MQDSSVYYSVLLYHPVTRHYIDCIGFISYEGDFSYSEYFDTSLLSDSLCMDTLSIKKEISDLYSRIHKICIDNGFVIIHYIVPKLSTEHCKLQFYLILYDRKHQTLFNLYKYDKDNIEYNERKSIILNDEKNHLLMEGWFVNIEEAGDD